MKRRFAIPSFCDDAARLGSGGVPDSAEHEGKRLRRHGVPPNSGSHGGSPTFSRSSQYDQVSLPAAKKRPMPDCGKGAGLPPTEKPPILCKRLKASKNSTAAVLSAAAGPSAMSAHTPTAKRILEALFFNAQDTASGKCRTTEQPDPLEPSAKCARTENAAGSPQDGATRNESSLDASSAKLPNTPTDAHLHSRGRAKHSSTAAALGATAAPSAPPAPWRTTSPQAPATPSRGIATPETPASPSIHQSGGAGGVLPATTGPTTPKRVSEEQQGTGSTDGSSNVADGAFSGQEAVANAAGDVSGSGGGDAHWTRLPAQAPSGEEETAPAGPGTEREDEPDLDEMASRMRCLLNDGLSQLSAAAAAKTERLQATAVDLERQLSHALSLLHAETACRWQLQEELDAKVKELRAAELLLEEAQHRTRAAERDACDAKASYDRGVVCQICFSRHRDVLLMPCMHFLYCRECLAKHLAASAVRICPACRSSVSGELVVHLTPQ